MNKKKPSCAVCDTPLICCTVRGKPAQNGAYRACPMALVEFDPGEFMKPWRARVHARAEVMEGPTARKNRLAEKRDQPLLFEDPKVGRGHSLRRARKGREDHMAGIVAGEVRGQE